MLLINEIKLSTCNKSNFKKFNLGIISQNYGSLILNSPDYKFRRIYYKILKFGDNIL